MGEAGRESAKSVKPVDLHPRAVPYPPVISKSSLALEELLLMERAGKAMLPAVAVEPAQAKTAAGPAAAPVAIATEAAATEATTS
jgi:hypothetical protein